MNDTELDGLLDSWQAPEPPPSLRARLRARFPRAERRGFRRPLRWLLAAGVATAIVAMAQSSAPGSDSPFVRLVTHVYEHIAEVIETHRVAAMVSNLRQSEPKVYVDGAPAPPLEFGHANVISVQVPGERPYRITFWSRGLQGWSETGSVHGNAIDFLARGHRVHIQCKQPIAGSDSPVYVFQQP